jgi:hypothetical protein
MRALYKDSSDIIEPGGRAAQILSSAVIMFTHHSNRSNCTNTVLYCNRITTS